MCCNPVYLKLLVLVLLLQEISHISQNRKLMDAVPLTAWHYGPPVSLLVSVAPNQSSTLVNSEISQQLLNGLNGWI